MFKKQLQGTAICKWQ